MTEDVSWRYRSPDTASGFMIILGAGKPCRKACCLLPAAARSGMLGDDRVSGDV